jgi:hypothetical protein
VGRVFSQLKDWFGVCCAVEFWRIEVLFLYERFKELRWHSLRIIYHGGHPMSRFALFTVALFVLVTIGSQSRSGGSSLKSMCVCVPTRAKLILKSAIVKTQARSAELFTSAQ